MPFIKLQLKPGINRDQTNYTNEGGWRDGNRIRFQSGFPQKLGGWVKASPTAFSGICRQLYNFVTTFKEKLLGLGTDTNFYAFYNAELRDITPFIKQLTPESINEQNVYKAYGPLGATALTHVIEGDDVRVVVTASHTFVDGESIVVQGLGAILDSESGVQLLSAAVLNGIFEVSVENNSTSEFSYLCVGQANNFFNSDGSERTAIVYPSEELLSSVYFDVVEDNILLPGDSSAPQGGGGTQSTGWGAFSWGLGSWGVSPAPAQNATIFVAPLKDWFISNIDNDMVANVQGGEIYYWERFRTLPYNYAFDADPFGPFNELAFRAVPDVSLATALTYRMRPLAEVAKCHKVNSDLRIAAIPTKVHQVLVSQNDKHLLALGCNPLRASPNASAVFDPLLIRWANQDEPWNWYPEITNSAGDIRVSRGSRIVQGLPTRQEILVFTDTTLYALQFTGTTDVFALQEYASNISIASPRAATTALDTVFWMGVNKFYMYSGRLQNVPCTVNDYVFEDLNQNQLGKIVAGTNEDWDEVWWFYPSKNSQENDRYVVFNYAESVWYYGDFSNSLDLSAPTVARDSWLDSGIFGGPLATLSTTNNEIDYLGYLYAHEEGVDADGEAMFSYISSSDIDINDGDKFAFITRVIPDIEFFGSNRGQDLSANPEVTFSVEPRNFPGEAPFLDLNDRQKIISNQITRFTKQVYMRARARQMAIRLESNKLGTDWRMGTFRVDVREDGKR